MVIFVFLLIATTLEVTGDAISESPSTTRVGRRELSIMKVGAF